MYGRGLFEVSYRDIWAQVDALDKQPTLRHIGPSPCNCSSPRRLFQLPSMSEGFPKRRITKHDVLPQWSTHFQVSLMLEIY